MANELILVVDDGPENLAAMRQVLSDDYHLVFAKNGKDALAAAFKHLPDMILLDVQMPDLSGYAVCERLKADPSTSDIPVIFVTVDSDVGREQEGFAVGAVDYIVKPFSPAVVRARVRTHLSLVRSGRLEQSYREAIYMLGKAGHYNDSDTGTHIWRMAAYASALARAIGWDTESCHMLELAAPLHDTGKLGIPDAILKKGDKLDLVEWEVMRTHPIIGHEILTKGTAPIFQMAAEISLCHHEKWDGSGYPGGLSGTSIPESARIVALADVFDALTMKRPYKESWPLERVISTLREGAGRHFEPRLVDTFLEILPQILAIKAKWDTAAPDAM